jgi:hypothetical protein
MPMTRRKLKLEKALADSLVVMLACVLITSSARSQDTTSPIVLSAQFGNSLDTIFVTYSEPMYLASALDRFNYNTSFPLFDSPEPTQADTDGRIFRLELPNPAPSMSGWELIVYDGYDLAGNRISPSPSIIPIQPVPEPSTIAVAAIAALTVVLTKRKRLTFRQRTAAGHRGLQSAFSPLRRKEWFFRENSLRANS